MSENKNYKMHLAINTHWDREYRWSFVETQLRLVEAVDLLIDTMEKDTRFKYFHTDSQASFLDDYLEIRPENTERVKKLVSEGRLLTGPWYTLPAEFLVSGEALVRNLLMGHKIASNLGGVMKAGYNIFSWGQVSQLPQIYRQFGMNEIMFYRGIDQSNLDKLEFIWKAPDGTETLGVTFSSYHRLNFWVYVYRPYINGGGLDRSKIAAEGGHLLNMCDSYGEDMNHRVVSQPCKRSFEDAREGLDTLLKTVENKSSTDSLLFLQGFDQENPDPIVSDIVDELNEKIDFGKIEVSTIGDYLADVRAGLEQKGLMDTLTVFDGEMLNVEKSDDPFAPLYNGVFSARMPLKQLNYDCQYRLEKWAEPAAIFADIIGKDYPYVSLQMAWKEILKNQQHDGIGGCHVDRITTSMEERYRNAKDLSEAITRDSLSAIVSDIDYSNIDSKEVAITVFNSTAATRSDVVEAVIDIPHDWGFRYIPGTSYKKPITLDIYDNRGNKSESQLLSLEDNVMYAYLKYGSHIHFNVTRCRVLFNAADIPAMGYASFKAVAKQSTDRPINTLSPEKNVLENEFLRAQINSDGTLSMQDKQNGREYNRLHYFEDDGEMGGPLIHQQPYDNSIYNTLGQSASVSVVYDGVLESKYKIERQWLLPESIETETKIHVPHGTEFVEQGMVRRSKRKEVLTITTFVSLKKGASNLEFETVVDNKIKDHRLRVCFDTDIDTDICSVDAPFDVVQREIPIPDSSGWYEAAARTLPSNSFVDVSDGSCGLGLVHRGLPEYEVVDDKHRTIALTLLRCFGTAGNNSETYVPQPLAQCQGTHTFKYAVSSHKGNWQEAQMTVVAEKFNNPLRVIQSSSHKGTLPQERSFFSIDNGDFVVTALKRAENSNGYILRGFNPTRKDIDIKLSLDKCVKNVKQLTLEEIETKSLEVKNSITTFKVGKGEIITLKLNIEDC